MPIVDDASSCFSSLQNATENVTQSPDSNPRNTVNAGLVTTKQSNTRPETKSGIPANRLAPKAFLNLHTFEKGKDHLLQKLGRPPLPLSPPPAAAEAAAASPPPPPHYHHRHRHRHQCRNMSERSCI